MLRERATMSRHTYIAYTLFYFTLCGRRIFFFKLLLIRGNTTNEYWCFEVVLRDKICYRNIGFWMPLFCDYLVLCSTVLPLTILGLPASRN